MVKAVPGFFSIYPFTMHLMKQFEEKETNSLVEKKFFFSKNLRHLGDPFQPAIINLFTYLHILRTILILFVRGIASDVLPNFCRNTEYLHNINNMKF
jgi:hypothetical protein